MLEEKEKKEKCINCDGKGVEPLLVLGESVELAQRACEWCVGTGNKLTPEEIEEYGG